MANKIYDNLYSQLDDKGQEILQYKGIIDHKKHGSDLTKDTGFNVLKWGHKKCKPTTRGWKFLVECRDETTTCMDLKDVKEAISIELAEYAVAKNIDDEPYFA